MTREEPTDPTASAGPPDIEREIEAGSKDKELSGFSELFFTPGTSQEEPLLFHHVQKTAGTALRKFIRSALPPHEREVRRVGELSRQPREALLAWYREWYRSLGARRQSELCCVMAHSANYLLPAMDRPVFAITLVRDPVDRAVSHYYGSKSRRGAPLVPPPGAPAAAEQAARQWTLSEVFAQMSGRSPREVAKPRAHIRAFNGQSRSLLAPHHDTDDLLLSDGPPPDADLWRERLWEIVDRHYLLGAHERFEDFVNLLGRRLGAEPWIPRAKVNSSRPPLSELPDDLRETIRAHNWLDAELHAAALATAQAAQRS